MLVPNTPNTMSLCHKRCIMNCRERQFSLRWTWVMVSRKYLCLLNFTVYSSHTLVFITWSASSFNPKTVLASFTMKYAKLSQGCQAVFMTPFWFMDVMHLTTTRIWEQFYSVPRTWASNSSFPNQLSVFPRWNTCSSAESSLRLEYLQTPTKSKSGCITRTYLSRGTYNYWKMLFARDPGEYVRSHRAIICTGASPGQISSHCDVICTGPGHGGITRANKFTWHGGPRLFSTRVHTDSVPRTGTSHLQTRSHTSAQRT